MTYGKPLSLAQVSRFLSCREVEATLQAAFPRADRQGPRQAAVLLVAIYGRATLADSFPMDKPWSREIVFSRSQLAKTTGLAPTYVDTLLEKRLAPAEVCTLVTSGRHTRVLLSEALFEPRQVAELIDWGTVLASLEGQTKALHVFWDLVGRRLSDPASELQAFSMREVHERLGYQKNTLSRAYRALEEHGLIRVERRPGATALFALSPLAMGRRPIPLLLHPDTEPAEPASAASAAVGDNPERTPPLDERVSRDEVAATPDPTPGFQRWTLRGRIYEVPTGFVPIEEEYPDGRMRVRFERLG
jgi:DNA-binding transcriptional ArsR family regulator